jgi:hypothetical protein
MKASNSYIDLRPALSSGPADSSGWTLFAVLLFGLAGQWFMGQWEKPETFLPACLLYACAIGLWLWFLKRSPTEWDEPEKGLNPFLEFLVLAALLLLALFLRVYRLDQFPAGILNDEACVGWGALRILWEGWRPFDEIYQLRIWDPSYYYLLAVWFHYFTPTQVHFFLFGVWFTILSFPLIYWTFRQWSGPRTALLALFLIAVSRWDITYSRNGHPAFQLHFYMFGALAFWTYAVRNKKAWSLWVSALFFAGGFYVYQAYKAFILVAALYLLYELWAARSREILTPLRLFALGLFTAALTAPVWLRMVRAGNLGPRETELSLFPRILDGGSLWPLLSHLKAGLLMFNRQGDSWLLHNIPYHRMLDNGTGLLFVLGFFLALTLAKERKFFYALAGLACMFLPSVLSIDAAHASRAYGTIPFIALLAAEAVTAAASRMSDLEKNGRKLLFGTGLVCLLAFVAYENFQTYFNEQAVNDACWRGPGTDATVVGKTIARYGGQYEYYLPSHFNGYVSVSFLGFSQRGHIHRWDIQGDLALEHLPDDRGAFWVLEQGQTGVLQLIQDLYPGGETEKVPDLHGNTMLTFYRLSHEQVERGRRNVKKFRRSDHGLEGSYHTSTNWKSAPVTVQVDPVLNFTFRNDFPVLDFPPLWVKWFGTLDIPKTGYYQFLTLTTDLAQVAVDRRWVLLAGNKDSKQVHLKKGRHKIEVLFQKATGTDTVLNLLWKEPKAEKFSVIPYTALKHEK